MKKSIKLNLLFVTLLLAIFSMTAQAQSASASQPRYKDDPKNQETKDRHTVLEPIIMSMPVGNFLAESPPGKLCVIQSPLSGDFAENKKRWQLQSNSKKV